MFLVLDIDISRNNYHDITPAPVTNHSARTGFSSVAKVHPHKSLHTEPTSRTAKYLQGGGVAKALLLRSSFSLRGVGMFSSH